nr:hypothetical protein TetV2_00334 [Oceanusvirus sp.]
MLRIHRPSITPAGRAAIDREAKRLLGGGEPEQWKNRGGGVWSAPAHDARRLQVYRTRVRLLDCTPKRAFHLLTGARGYPILDPHAQSFSTVERHGRLGNVMRSVDDFWGIRRDFYTLDRKDNAQMLFTSKTVEDGDSLISGSAETAHLTFALTCSPDERGDDTNATVTTATYVDYGIDTHPCVLDAISCGFVRRLNRRIESALTPRRSH